MAYYPIFGTHLSCLVSERPGGDGAGSESSADYSRYYRTESDRMVRARQASGRVQVGRKLLSYLHTILIK